MNAALSSRSHPAITSPKLKAGVYALEALNALATTYFFYYVYFYTKEKFGFGALQNFLLAAAIGATYACSAFFGGRFAQRFGYFRSIRLGTAIMIAAFLVGGQIDSVAITIALMIIGNVGMCFTWPALQGLMSEGEPPARLQGVVGVYNFTWAIAGAFAYFTGGAMFEKWTLRSMFYTPAALLMVQMGFSIWLEKAVQRQPSPTLADETPVLHPMAETPRSAVPSKTFLKMAWLANPFAYLAANTIIAIIPTLAEHLKLTPKLAGFVCSVWLFVRAGSFVLLRLWPKWHYKFRYLAGAYAIMIVSFVTILRVPNLWVLMLAQITLGLALGLIYYSSLFYSMDVGETKGEHGGIHEAAIGAGCSAGPAIAASALIFFPNHPGSSAYAVSLLLLIGLGGLFWMRYRKQT